MRTLLILSAFLMLVVSPILLVAAEEAVGPLNDDFDTATVVIDPLPFIDAIDTTHATTAANDPLCAGNGHSVWYAYTPSADITITAHTLGSDYATTLSVYTDERGALTQIACNSGESLGPASVTFDATRGTTYFFMVASLGEEPGGVLNFTVTQEEAAGDPPCPAAGIPQDGRTCTVCLTLPAFTVPITWGGMVGPRASRNLFIMGDPRDNVMSLSCAATACAVGIMACNGPIPAGAMCTVEATLTVSTAPATPNPGSGTSELGCQIFGTTPTVPNLAIERTFRIVVIDRELF
jgi:hypothetical protein